MPSHSPSWEQGRLGGGEEGPHAAPPSLHPAHCSLPSPGSLKRPPPGSVFLPPLCTQDSKGTGEAAWSTPWGHRTQIHSAVSVVPCHLDLPLPGCPRSPARGPVQDGGERRGKHRLQAQLGCGSLGGEPPTVKLTRQEEEEPPVYPSHWSREPARAGMSPAEAGLQAMRQT